MTSTACSDWRKLFQTAVPLRQGSCKSVECIVLRDIKHFASHLARDKLHGLRDASSVAPARCTVSEGSSRRANIGEISGGDLTDRSLDRRELLLISCLTQGCSPEMSPISQEGHNEIAFRGRTIPTGWAAAHAHAGAGLVPIMVEM
jgi:hypothetical protein